MRHHTKDKGDEGLGRVIACLLSNGIQVALPISEHLPFDCIAISPANKLARVSVKYRELSARGIIEVRKRSVWSNGKGAHVKHHIGGDYDVVAIFCPTTSKCYFVLFEEFGQTLWLHADKADAFADPGRMFK